jgi:hypothetical protein
LAKRRPAISIEKAWTNRQRTKERLLELADRAPSERFWQASNADDDAVLAAMLAAADLRGAERECVACGCKGTARHMKGCEVQAMRTRLAALKSPAKGEKE